MADSPVFDHTCAELERRTELDRLAARGTVRLALREAGLDVASVDARQMDVVLAKVLPTQLDRRGVADAAGVCAAIAEVLERTVFEVAQDRAGEAAAKVARLGS